MCTVGAENKRRFRKKENHHRSDSESESTVSVTRVSDVSESDDTHDCQSDRVQRVTDTPRRVCLYDNMIIRSNL